MLWLCSSLQLNALKSWKSTNSVKSTVPVSSSRTPRKLKAYCVSMMSDMKIPVANILIIIGFVRMLSLRPVGFRFMRSS